jgi:hypothetical protein
MKTLKRHRLILLGIFTVGSIFVATTLTVWSQSTPFLSITPLGTNQYSITFTNSPPSTYDVQWTPYLNNPDYPWTWAAVGTNGQSTFQISGGVYPSGFFRTILDTNSVPLWEAADPNNPAAGILTVTIDSPANGAVIQ